MELLIKNHVSVCMLGKFYLLGNFFPSPYRTHFVI